MDMCVSFKISTAVTNHLAGRMRKGIFQKKRKDDIVFQRHKLEIRIGGPNGKRDGKSG